MDRKGILEQKLKVQRVKNVLKQLKGIEILELYEKDEKEALNAVLEKYVPIQCSVHTVPFSRISNSASDAEVYQWIISEFSLAEGQIFYYFCEEVWVRIRIIDLQAAVSSMWRYEVPGSYVPGITVGFLLVDETLSTIMEVGSDSRDEYHYLIDIWRVDGA